MSCCLFIQGDLLSCPFSYKVWKGLLASEINKLLSFTDIRQKDREKVDQINMVSGGFVRKSAMKCVPVTGLDKGVLPVWPRGQRIVLLDNLI